MQRRKPPLPALTVKLSKYNVDDVALGVCKTGAEEAGVTEVRTSLSEKKFELWRDINFFLMIRRPPRSPLFPHTTLSRSTRKPRTKAPSRSNPSSRRCLPSMACSAKLPTDRKSTRLNSSHGYISYAVFCLKKKK